MKGDRRGGGREPRPAVWESALRAGSVPRISAPDLTRTVAVRHGLQTKAWYVSKFYHVLVLDSGKVI